MIKDYEAIFLTSEEYPKICTIILKPKKLLFDNIDGNENITGLIIDLSKPSKHFSNFVDVVEKNNKSDTSLYGSTFGDFNITYRNGMVNFDVNLYQKSAITVSVKVNSSLIKVFKDMDNYIKNLIGNKNKKANSPPTSPVVKRQTGRPKK